MSGKIKSGFTIVELLIVIVVIAILAAITVVAFNGIRQRALESSIQSDLRNGATALELDKTTNGSYPWSASSVNNGTGLKTSGDNQLTYLGGTTAFCLLIENPSINKTFHIDSKDHQVGEGTCGVFGTTYVGSTTSGTTNATGLAAQFNRPADVAVDSNGNLFVADYSNHVIRMVTPAGVVSTFAGTGSPGAANGPGGSAQFNYPMGLAIDSANNLYVAEWGTDRIRKVTPSADVSTIAGSSSGFLDHTNALSAQFNNPTDLAVNAAGEVFISDKGNNRVRVLRTSGAVETFAGSGTPGGGSGNGTSAQLHGPSGMAIDGSGTLFVIEDAGHRLRKITPTKDVSTLAGTGSSGYADNPNGLLAQFSWPQGLGIGPTGDLFVMDSNNGYIRKVTQAGVVTTVAGSPTQGDTDGFGETMQFRYAWNLTVDSNGTIYVADSWGNRIRKIVL